MLRRLLYIIALNILKFLRAVDEQIHMFFVVVPMSLFYMAPPAHRVVSVQTALGKIRLTHYTITKPEESMCFQNMHRQVVEYKLQDSGEAVCREGTTMLFGRRRRVLFEQKGKCWFSKDYFARSKFENDWEITSRRISFELAAGDDNVYMKRCRMVLNCLVTDEEHPEIAVVIRTGFRCKGYSVNSTGDGIVLSCDYGNCPNRTVTTHKENVMVPLPGTCVF